MLMNAGYVYLIDKMNSTCQYIYLHDVDMLVESTARYGNFDSEVVEHLATNASQFSYTLPYFDYIGGVLGISTRLFESVDGFSNCYWGWGGEDDDFYHRLRNKNITIRREQKPRILSMVADHTERDTKGHGKNVQTLERRKRSSNYCPSGLSDVRRFFDEMIDAVALPKCTTVTCNVTLHPDILFKHTSAMMTKLRRTV
eukprot:gene15146-17916_t